MSSSLLNEKISKIIELSRQDLSSREIGRQLGISDSTVRKYLNQHSVSGEAPPKQHINQLINRLEVDGTLDIVTLDRPASEQELMRLAGCDSNEWIKQFFYINTWQGFYKLKCGNDHRKVQLYQSKLSLKRVLTGAQKNAILKWVGRIKPLPKPKLGRRKRVGEYAVSWGIWDAHLGMYAWNEEVGADYDIKIAANRVCNSIDDICEELSLYKIDKIFMPIGNDFLHYDSVRKKTALGEHEMDTDSRFQKVLDAGIQCSVYMMERALDLCDDVVGMYIRGNHDATLGYALCAALRERFRNDPRVTMDLRACPRKYKTYGGCLLGWSHGDKIKLDRFISLITTEAKEEWGRSTYREIQLGHLHQDSELRYDGVIPTNGFLIRRNPCLSNVDMWAFERGLIGQPVKAVEAWRYDKVAYRGSHVAWARDEEHARAK